MNVSYQRLGRKVRERRLELDLSQRDVAVRAGVSNQTWLNVENGRSVSERSLRKIERALGWSSGMAAAIAAGRKPPALSPAGGDGPPNLNRDRLLEALATEDLTADEIEEVFAFVIQLWRERHGPPTGSVDQLVACPPP